MSFERFPRPMAPEPRALTTRERAIVELLGQHQYRSARKESSCCSCGAGFDPYAGSAVAAWRRHIAQLVTVVAPSAPSARRTGW